MPAFNIVVYNKARLRFLENEYLKNLLHHNSIHEIIDSENINSIHGKELLTKNEKNIQANISADIIAKLNITSAALKLHISKSDSYVTNLTDSVRTIEHTMKMITTNKVKVKKYFKALAEDATPMFEQLLAATWQKINTYENFHTYNQSLAERIFWYEIKEQLNGIPLISYQQQEGVTNSDAQLARCQFALLCGFLQCMARRMMQLVEQKNIYIDFGIGELLAKTHIAMDGDLPKPYQLNIACSEFYAQIPDLYQVANTAEFYHLELNLYHVALNKLKHNAAGGIIYNDKITTIIASIEAAKEKEYLPNLKYYTLLLDLTYRCLGAEVDEVAFAILKNLAQAAPGTPSRWNYAANLATGAANVVSLAALIYVTVSNASATTTQRLAVFSTLFTTGLFAIARHCLPTTASGVAAALQSTVAASEDVLRGISLR